MAGGVWCLVPLSSNERKLLSCTVTFSYTWRSRKRKTLGAQAEIWRLLLVVEDEDDGRPFYLMLAFKSHEGRRHCRDRARALPA